MLDAVIQRAKTGGVRHVICGGKTVYADGRFTRVDQAAALKALHDDLAHALPDDEVERRRLSKALLPHVKRFYAGSTQPCARTARRSKQAGCSRRAAQALQGGRSWW